MDNRMPLFQLIIHLVLVLSLIGAYLVITLDGKDGQMILQTLTGYGLARGIDFGSTEYRRRNGNGNGEK